MGKHIDTVLAALADPVRRRLTEELRRGPRRAGALATAVGVTAPAASKHLRVLRTAGMVAEERDPEDNRARVYRLRPERFDLLARWLDETRAFWNDQLTGFADYVATRAGTPDEPGRHPAGRSTDTADVIVPTDPDTAFKLFTDEIGIWWRRGSRYWADAERAQTMRFEPGTGGRLFEVYDADTGDGYALGRVAVWEPGQRLVFGWTLPDWGDVDTEVEVRFTAEDTGTRVSIEHRGLDRVGYPGAVPGYSAGWAELLGWYAETTR